MDLYPWIVRPRILPLYRYCLPCKENPGQTCLEWSIEKIVSAKGLDDRRNIALHMQPIANVHRLVPIVNI